MTDTEHMNIATIRLLRQLAEDLEAGKSTVLNIKIDDSWRDDPISGQSHKILSSRTWSISAAIAPRLPEG